MTKDDLAKLLNGREYTGEMTKVEEAQADKDGLVVLFGGSDDLAEFRGAIRDEGDCYEGGTFYLHRGGLLEGHESGCECKFCGYKEQKGRCAVIKALWDSEGYSWVYETAIPHVTFEILDEGAKYCRGIVFRLDDLPVLEGSERK